MKKKLLSIILCGSLIAALLPSGVLASADDATDMTDVTVAADEVETVSMEKLNLGGDESAQAAVSPEAEAASTDEAVPADAEETAASEDDAADAADSVTYKVTKDDVTVEVEAPADALPEGAELSVTLFAEDSEEYEEAAEAIDYEIVEENTMLALDISFLLDGEEVEPAEPVKVSLDLSKVLPEEADTSSLEVQHLEEKRFGRVNPVVVATVDEEEKDAVEGTIDEKTSVAEFELESFSTFTVTWTWSGGSDTSPVTYEPYLEVTIYLDDTELDEMENLVFNTVDYELDLVTLLDTNEHYGNGDHTFSYAYLTYGTNNTNTLGSADNSIIAIEIEDGHGQPTGDFFNIIFADGTNDNSSVQANSTYSDDAVPHLYVYYTTSDPAVEITSVDQDIYGDWLVEATLQHVGEYDSVTYSWKVYADETCTTESDLAYVDRADSVGGAYIVWHSGVANSGDSVYVQVTATVTYADGSTEDLVLTDVHELDYGLEDITLQVLYNADGTETSVGAGVQVTLTSSIYDGQDRTLTTDASGTASASIVPGVYEVTASYTDDDGKSYSYSGTLSMDYAGTYTIVLLEDDAELSEDAFPDKEDWNHVDVKLSASSSSYGISSGETTFTITSVIITDENGATRYVATTESINAGENDTEFQIQFYEADSNGNPTGEASHTISFSSTDTITIGYSITYNADDPDTAYTLDYTVKITKDTAYPHGTYYPATGERAYKLYNYLYGTSYQSDAELLLAGVTDIDISGMSIMLVAAILCDSSETGGGAGDLSGQDGMWGLDFSMSPEAFAILGNTWVADIEKTYLNHELVAGDFSFYLIDSDYDETTELWSLDEEYWMYDLHNSDVIRGIDGNASQTFTGVYVTFDDSRFWYDESREDSTRFTYDQDGNLIRNAQGCPVDADGNPIESNQRYGRHHYYIVVEQPGDDPGTIYDGTVFGVDVWTYADDPYDMTSTAHIEATYYLLSRTDDGNTSETQPELNYRWVTIEEAASPQVTVDDEGYPTFHFVNEFVDYILLYKEDQNGNSVEGAKFTLVQDATDNGNVHAYYYYDPYLDQAEPWVYIGNTEAELASANPTAFEMGDVTVTNSEGETVTVCGMQLSTPYDGDYTLTEVEAPGGYAMLPSGIVFTVKDYEIVSVAWADASCTEDIADYVYLTGAENEAGSEAYYELHVEDPYSIRIYKQDENGKAISGAKFTLTLYDGTYYYYYDPTNEVNVWVAYDPASPPAFAEFEFEQLTETYVDADGNTQSMTVYGFDLDSPLNGTYTLTEVSAPGGVTLIPYGISFELETGRIVENSVTWAAEYTGTEQVSDYVSLGSPNEGEENSWQLYAEDPDVVRLYKQDENGNALDGAYFTLTQTIEGTSYYYNPDDPNGPWVAYDPDSEEPVAVAFEAMQETVESGTGSTVETVYGWELDSPADATYVLTEVTAPSGYGLLPGSITFTITGYRIDENSVAWTDDTIPEAIDTYVTIGDEDENWQLFIADEPSYYFGLDKVDEDEGALDGAKFALYSGSGEDADPLGFIYDESASTYTMSADTTADGYTTEITAGSVIITGLPAGTYYLKETEAPEGYIHLAETITLVVEAADDSSGSSVAGAQQAKVTLSGESSHVSVSSDDNNTVVVENDSTDVTRIDVEKVWDDEGNQDGVRPDSITVSLTADDENTGQTLTLNEGNDWKGSFTGLPLYQSDEGNGATEEKVVYQISESFEVSYHDDYDGKYTVTYDGASEDGTLTYNDETEAYSVTITNSYTPETISIEGTKTWEFGSYTEVYPASITIHLLADGTELDSQTVTSSERWSWSFTGLPKYANGTEITYTVTEDAVTGFETTVNGYDVTNTFTPETVDLTVEKVWKDHDTNSRPSDITITLLADGTETGETLTLNDSNDWTDTFSGLLKYDYENGGTEITYSVSEVSVEGYNTDVGTLTDNGNGKYSITVTNTSTDYREYFPIDEEIVVDESSTSTWVKNEAVNEYYAIELEMATLLPHFETPADVLTDESAFTMNFHEVLDSQLNLDETDADFSVYIGTTQVAHQYYTVTISPDDDCTFHVDVDLTALYRDEVIDDDDLQGDTVIMIFFYADLEGTGLNGSYKSTVWYDVYDGDTWQYTSNEDVVYLYTYEVEILKYDISTLNGSDYAGSGLAGATLGIYYDAACTDPVYRYVGTGFDESEKLAYTVTSEEDGYAIFYGLADGTYYVKETEAPAGYELSDEVLTVTLTESLVNSNYTYTAVFANAPEGWEAPNGGTGGSGGGTNTAHRAKTSDTDTLGLWLLLMVSGALFATAGSVLRRKSARARNR